MEPIIIRPIGYVHSDRNEPIDDKWFSVRTWIQLCAPFEEEALLGLEMFSHIEVIYLFNQVSEDQIEIKSRHPRERKDLPKVGIFAQRSKDRPNRLGVTRCKILGIEGTRIELEGLDAIHGSPIIDIKPVYRELESRGTIMQPDWVGEIMRNYF